MVPVEIETSEGARRWVYANREEFWTWSDGPASGRWDMATSAWAVSAYRDW